MTKGLWISLDLLHDKNTTMQEKLLLVEITQLSMLDKGCIASNNHFAELLQVKKESVSRSISSLESKGYITTKIKEGSRNHERVITVNKMLFDPKQNVIDPKQNVIDPLTNCLETKENKTINKTVNKTINNNIIAEIVNHLNQVLNTNYKPNGSIVQKLIKAKLKQGFTLEDFKKVHITKYAEWNGTDMQKYLRPETLYGTKFESYLNQKLTNNEKYRAISEHTGMSALEMLRREGRA